MTSLMMPRRESPHRPQPTVEGQQSGARIATRPKSEGHLPVNGLEQSVAAVGARLHGEQPEAALCRVQRRVLYSPLRLEGQLHCTSGAAGLKHRCAGADGAAGEQRVAGQRRVVRRGAASGAAGGGAEVAVHVAGEQRHDAAGRGRLRAHELQELLRGEEVPLLRPPRPRLRLPVPVHSGSPFRMTAHELRRQVHAGQCEGHVQHQQRGRPAPDEVPPREVQLLLGDLVVGVVEHEDLDALQERAAVQSAVGEQAGLEQGPERGVQVREALRVVPPVPRKPLCVPVVVASGVDEGPSAAGVPHAVQHPMHRLVGGEVHNVPAESDQVHAFGAGHLHQADELRGGRRRDTRRLVDSVLESMMHPGRPGGVVVAQRDVRVRDVQDPQRRTLLEQPLVPGPADADDRVPLTEAVRRPRPSHSLHCAQEDEREEAPNVHCGEETTQWMGYRTG
eukprot:CAMPEP_0204511398 /NCGR_PEP_ID=MMETSP0661-20131031/403_1 /ASSEMBLY_ACC=CAM_ASM_000606 /TAXON_ID=109239 /ORGANISM="Alexandrium margalefi, Strain AMGDE01CS-322" /LENGTH=448 /DNA_ID=CAMNT_0051516481 /DNA_START=75 /DNA_END=1417 /DNA_ORIENTATION=-